jgi:hypothetical protein
MQVTNNLIPVESDVNQFLSKQRALLDTDIADLFREFKLAKLLKDCNIKKRCGHPVPKNIYDLFFIPFLSCQISTCLFIHSMKRPLQKKTGIIGCWKTQNSIGDYL